MIADSGRYADAIGRFDAANAEDPNTESTGGVAEPKELVYARRMTAMLERFAPDAPEAVRLAVRCQHIRRWEIPRESYPRTPEGYQAWRKRLLDYHAELAARILRDAGYDEGMIARVASTVRKERLKSNPEAQMLEDVVGTGVPRALRCRFCRGAPAIQRSEAARHPPEDLQEDVPARARRGTHLDPPAGGARALRPRSGGGRGAGPHGN